MFYTRNRTPAQQLWEERLYRKHNVCVVLRPAYANTMTQKLGPEIVLLPRGKLRAHVISGMQQPGYMEGELHIYPVTPDPVAEHGLVGDMRLLGYTALQVFFSEIRQSRAANTTNFPYFIKCFGWNPFPDLRRTYYTWQQRAYIEEQLVALAIVPDYSVPDLTTEQVKRLLAAI